MDTQANVRIHGTLKQRPVDRFEAERPHLMPLVPWAYRSVVPRSQDSASAENPEERFPPVVEVQRRPLADYARISGGVS